jgi:hypothetical protein
VNNTKDTSHCCKNVSHLRNKSDPTCAKFGDNHIFESITGITMNIPVDVNQISDFVTREFVIPMGRRGVSLTESIQPLDLDEFIFVEDLSPPISVGDISAGGICENIGFVYKDIAIGFWSVWSNRRLCPWSFRRTPATSARLRILASAL